MTIDIFQNIWYHYENKGITLHHVGYITKIGGLYMKDLFKKLKAQEETPNKDVKKPQDELSLKDIEKVVGGKGRPKDRL